MTVVRVAVLRMSFFIGLSLSCCISVVSQNLDVDILKTVNVNRNKSLDGTFGMISDSVLPLTVAVPAGLITYAIITKDSADKSKAILVCSSLLISGIITTSMKYGFQRNRPFEDYAFIDRVTHASGYSFPSGHTSTAFAMATSLSMAYPKWYVISGSFVWASAVGYSRMELGVHYPSDVLVGAIIGSGSAFLSKKLNNWINHRGRHKTHIK